VILTIGRHGKGVWGPTQARKEAIRLLGLIRDGKDPAVERAEDKAAPTLAELAQRYGRRPKTFTKPVTRQAST
jgi:Arm DNA-binding domain